MFTGRESANSISSVPAASYIRVPAKLQAQVILEIRRWRIRCCVLYFPVLLLLFSGLGAGFLLWKGHGVPWLAEQVFHEKLTERTFYLIVSTLIVGAAAAAVLFRIFQNCREGVMEEHLFCAPCDAVDADDEGLCPVCAMVLTVSAGFVYTSDAGELKRLAIQGKGGDIDFVCNDPKQGASP